MIHTASHTPCRAAASHRLFVSLLAVDTALALASTGCDRGQQEGGADEQPAAGAEAPRQVTLEPERGAVQFVHMRLSELANERLPEAIEQEQVSKARRLCEVARRRVRALVLDAQTSGSDPELEKVSDEVHQVCSRDVGAMILDDLIARASQAPEDERTTHCQAGSVYMAFVYDHRSDEPEIVRRREEVFELCPGLAQEWQAVEKAMESHQAGEEPEDVAPVLPLPGQAPPHAPPPQPPE